MIFSTLCHLLNLQKQRNSLWVVFYNFYRQVNTIIVRIHIEKINKCMEFTLSVMFKSVHTRYCKANNKRRCFLSCSINGGFCTHRSSTYHNPHTVGVLYYVFDLINYVSAILFVCWHIHSSILWYSYLCCRHFSTSFLLLLCVLIPFIVHLLY